MGRSSVAGLRGDRTKGTGDSRRLHPAADAAVNCLAGPRSGFGNLARVRPETTSDNGGGGPSIVIEVGGCPVAEDAPRWFDTQLGRGQVAYSAMVRRFMVSAPGDIPDTDIECINTTVYRWNVTYGPSYSAVVLPVGWRLNAAPTHGVRPQESLNSQLVESADFVLALFWHRLGTNTGVERSGTVEEIELALQLGHPVAILRCDRPIAPSDIDNEQFRQLENYFEEIGSRSLYMKYVDTEQLAAHVHTILSGFVTRDQAELAPRQQPGGDQGADIRARVSTRSRGLRGAGADHFLVLHNVGHGIARNVIARLEPESPDDRVPQLLDADRPIEVFAPDSETRYHLVVTFGTATQVRCVVTWDDTTGQREGTFTLRFT